jgi:signal transduction histidine kinase
LRSITRRLPLELKLPLLMSAVLAVVLSIALIVTYSTLRASALGVVRDRLTRATRQIATVASSGVLTQHTRYVRAARDSAILRALARPGPATARAAQEALGRLAQPNDSGMAVELWSATGSRIAFHGNDVAVTMREDMRDELPERITLALDPAAPRIPDSLRVGPLYRDQDRMHFWLVMPVIRNGRVLGYITHQRRIATSAQTLQTLRELSGDSVSLYWRNVDGSNWSTRTSVAAAPHADADSVAGVARGANGERLLFSEERIGGTPLVVGMSLPEREVLTSSRRVFRTIFGLAIALLAGGVLASALIGRSVARPLGRITDAVGALAAGDYGARVPEKGDVEITRLAQSFNHMAGELGTSRANLEKQTAEAHAANSAKSEFLTTMSHELRTPLNAIGGYVELLEMGLRGPVSDEQKRDLHRIKVSQQHLLGLISGVLDLSRIEAGRVRYELADVAVDPFLSSIGALVAPQAAAKSIELEYHPSPADLAVIADREKLRQILLNLLSNAVRHTPAGGVVTISAESRGARAAIVVDDTGPGIPEDKLEEIFEPFVQLDRSLTQSREGLGLGLAISRDLARGMSGDLTAEIRLGGGARFVLVLPRGQMDERTFRGVSGEMPAVGT